MVFIRVWNDFFLAICYKAGKFSKMSLFKFYIADLYAFYNRI